MFKKIFVGIIFIIGVIIALSFLDGGTLSLDVTTTEPGLPFTQLNLKNTGTTPIIIKDVVVNDRPDCSTIATPDATQRSLHSNDELHQLWMHGVSLPVDTSDPSKKQDINSLKTLEIKIGDSYTVISPCNSIVRVNVVTDQGSATYTFSRR